MRTLKIVFACPSLLTFSKKDSGWEKMGVFFFEPFFSLPFFFHKLFNGLLHFSVYGKKILMLAPITLLQIKPVAVRAEKILGGLRQSLGAVTVRKLSRSVWM